jgi:hypothetical protein
MELATDRDGCWTPARVGWRKLRRDTERVDRRLDRPARVLAAAASLQAAIGPAKRGAIQVTTGNFASR